jgi:hypothetical protein
MRQAFGAFLLVVATVGASTPVGPAPQTPSLRGYPALGAPATVSLLNAGAEPRRQLRYVVPAGHKTTLLVTASGALTSSVGGRAALANSPTWHATIAVTVASVAASGDLSFDFDLGGVTVEGSGGMPEEDLQGLNRTLRTLAPIKGRATISDRGIVRSSEVPIPAPFTREMLLPVIAVVERLLTPLPDAPVGVGARWEVRAATQTAGTVLFFPTVFERAEHEVLSIDGSSVSLRVKTEQTGPAQALHNATVSLDMRMERLHGWGLGASAFHLNSLSHASDISSTSSTFGTTIQAGQPVQVTFSERARVVVEPAGNQVELDRTPELDLIRGLRSVSLSGTGTSSVGPDRVCYPRAAAPPGGPSREILVPMGSLLEAARAALQSGGLEVSARSTDFLEIDAQIRDAALCKATITLELHRGLGRPYEVWLPGGKLVTRRDRPPVVWRRTFDLQGPPAGFSDQVAERLKRDAEAFAADVARANRARR